MEMARWHWQDAAVSGAITGAVLGPLPHLPVIFQSPILNEGVITFFLVSAVAGAIFTAVMFMALTLVAKFSRDLLLVGILKRQVSGDTSAVPLSHGYLAYAFVGFFIYGLLLVYLLNNNSVMDDAQIGQFIPMLVAPFIWGLLGIVIVVISNRLRKRKLKKDSAIESED